MKTLIKIIILIIAVISAIGGIMIYAKTRVEPPIALKQTNQYRLDINNISNEMYSINDAKLEDEIYTKTINRIQIFANEGKIDDYEKDTCLNIFVRSYSTKFLKRTFESFFQSEWSDKTHNYILSQSNKLKELKNSDNSFVIENSSIGDSLNIAANIIKDYRIARNLSRVSEFTRYGYDGAKEIITKVRGYINNQYIYNCQSLVSDLSDVDGRLANSCYNWVISQINELANYESYSSYEYNNELKPKVYQIVTDYDNYALSTFGSKENVDDLWKIVRENVENADSYYSY